jgi:dynein heavy chain
VYIHRFLLSTTLAASKKPLELVLFQFALEHVARISRILRQPGGHALLVGVGGSGKQSSTRIAAFVSGMDCQQIAISRGYGIPEFREDIKKFMIQTGVEGQQTVFLFTDSQIVVETMLEDINNVLNSGEIPNLFPQDEMDKICAGMVPVLKEMGMPESRDNCISQFVLRVRDKLHIVLGMSPVGVRCACGAGTSLPSSAAPQSIGSCPGPSQRWCQ